MRRLRHTTAALIACKNGEGTIGNTVRSAATQADVFVVSDGSTDRTAEVTREAGARVYARQTSGGKPEALRAGNRRFKLSKRYRYVAVLDDDTTIEPRYVEKLVAKLDADPKLAAASGRIDSLWDHTRRWNPMIAIRAFMYWSYQVTIKRGQNALKVVNVICGANTIFRADVFAALIDEDVPYAIDDMFWLAEIVRRKLGRVAYVHSARSWTIDPHTFQDWYRQTVRWSWAQFQSIRGHRLGFRLSWFDFAYLALLIDWAPYMLEPLLFAPAAYLLRDWIDPIWFLVWYLGSSFAWMAVAAAALRKPRLLVLAPVLVVLDLVYRFAMLHACIKAIREPRSAAKWDSPERFELEPAAAASLTPVEST